VGVNCGDIAFGEAGVSEWMRVYQWLVAEDKIGRKLASGRSESKAVTGESRRDKKASWTAVGRSNDGCLVWR
jgi:hypothetical protein